MIKEVLKFAGYAYVVMVLALLLAVVLTACSTDTILRDPKTKWGGPYRLTDRQVSPR